jgi:hypothetical protein
MSPSSESKSKESKKQAQSGDKLSLVSSSTMTMKLTCSFETWVHFKWTIGVISYKTKLFVTSNCEKLKTFEGYDVGLETPTAVTHEQYFPLGFYGIQSGKC